MDQIYEQENFFSNPLFVRKHAINSDYVQWRYDSNSIYSGHRSALNDLDIKNELITNLQKIASKKIRNVNCCYHLNPGNSMHGFPHHDSTDRRSFAGVVYLNDIIPIQNCGTTIYKDLPENKTSNDYISDYRSKMEIVYSPEIHPNNTIKRFLSEECLNFKRNILQPIISIKNSFNKVVCYPGYVLHSPDFYFGHNKKDSRLTIAFHGLFE